MGKLILLRHGESEWNKKNIFTGWVDIPLSERGIEEALQAGRELADHPVDVIYTSTLIRGAMTAMLAMTCHHSKKTPMIVHEEGEHREWFCNHNPKMDRELIPVYCAWELNERMYGKLQGCNKQEMGEAYGEDQVKLWRRSYDIAPPAGESLKMTAARTLPYFEQVILPPLKLGKNILIVAHGNSLRSIVMQLDGLDEDGVLHLEIPTGKPLYYQYQQNTVTRYEF